MKFGAMKPSDAVGGVTVHSIRQNGLVLKKGTLIGAAEVEALAKAGVNEIVVAKLEPGDISEDEAAASIARRSAARASPSSARSPAAPTCSRPRPACWSLTARRSTASTASTKRSRSRRCRTSSRWSKARWSPPSRSCRSACRRRLRDEAIGSVPHNVLRVAPYRIRKVGIVSTLLPGLAKKVVEKTLQVTAERLAPAGAKIIAEKRIAHDEKELTAAISELFKQGAELVIVFGASAIADRRDVIPAAIERAGGKVEHFGMPVDPGNLMLIGQVNGAPVLGAPGCARSPKENGFDWILMRLLAGLAGDARGHHRPRRRRAADGDRHAAAAARRRWRRRQSQCRRDHPCGRAIEPHGRTEQAA